MKKIFYWISPILLLLSFSNANAVSMGGSGSGSDENYVLGGGQNSLGANYISSLGFVSGYFGKGFKINKNGDAEFNNIDVRGRIRTSVFEKNTISVLNGIFMVSSGDTLAEDMTALDASTLTITGDTTFIAGEVLRIKDGDNDEYLLVTDAGSAPTYTVERDKAGGYASDSNPAWTKGTAVTSIGRGSGSTTGFLLLDASSTNSPYLDIYSRNSTTYDDIDLKVRIGNLEGIVDTDVGLNGTATYGIYTTSGYFKGTVVSSVGKIGGWTLDTYEIKDTAGNTGMSCNVTGGDDVRFWAGHATPGSAPFRVTEAGALTATNATITGAITATSGSFTGAVTATSGTVGGFTVNSTDGLYSGTGATRVQMKPGVGIWTGATAQADALNYLNVDGSGWLADGEISWTSGGNLRLGTDTTYYNVGLGYNCVDAITNGEQNIGVGYEVLTANTTGDYNCGNGYRALYSNVGGSGNYAGGTLALYSNTSGVSNVSLGTQAGYYNTTGSYNVFLGDAAGKFQNNGSTALQTPEDSVYLGTETYSGSDPSGGEDAITNEIVIGAYAVGNGTNTVTLGGSSIAELHCKVALTVDSDRRIKENIVTLPSALDFIDSLNPVTFNKINPKDWPEQIRPPMPRVNVGNLAVDHREWPEDDPNTHLGLIAQELEETLQKSGLDWDLVKTGPNGKKSITYESLIIPLIKAVQELSAKQQILLAQVAKLEKKGKQ